MKLSIYATLTAICAVFWVNGKPMRPRIVSPDRSIKGRPDNWETDPNWAYVRAGRLRRGLTRMIVAATNESGEQIEQAVMWPVPATIQSSAAMLEALQQQIETALSAVCPAWEMLSPSLFSKSQADRWLIHYDFLTENKNLTGRAVYGGVIAGYTEWGAAASKRAMGSKQTTKPMNRGTSPIVESEGEAEQEDIAVDESGAPASPPERLREWIAANLKIRPREMKGVQSGQTYDYGVVPFDNFRAGQNQFFDALEKAREEQRPAWFVWLKSRQNTGSSTASAAAIYALVDRTPHKTGFVMAHKVPNAQNIFRTIQRFHHYQPEQWRKKLKGEKVHKDHLEYDGPHFSEVYVTSALAKAGTRSFTLSYILISEAAFFDKLDDTLQELLATVPKPHENWDTCVIVESTPYGDNDFKALWDLACSGKSFWTPIFSSWKDEPQCRMAAPADWEPDQQELEFGEKYNLGRDQLYWANHIRINELRGSWERFHTEYPVHPDLAFAFAGFPWFQRDRLQTLLDRPLEPIFTGDIDWASATLPIATLVARPQGPLSIWEDPIPGVRYSLGCDPAEGVRADYSEILVMRNDTGTVIAHFRSNVIRQEELAAIAFMLGSYYNNGLLGVERNVGLAVLQGLQNGLAHYPQMSCGYPNLYYEVRMDRRIDEETNRMGFGTTQKTKRAGLARLAEAFAKGTLTPTSLPLMRQMAGFAWDPERRDWTQNFRDEETGLRADDGIMTLMIANEMRCHAMGDVGRTTMERESFSLKFAG